MAKYVSQDGLNLFWSGIKTKLRAKVDVVEGKGLSTNDLTTALKNNYDAAFDNRVTGVTVNGATNASKAKFVTVKYDAVADPSGDPSAQGWYEENSGSYTATSDTEVDAEKTYYTKTEGIRVLDIVMPTKLQDLSNDATGKYATESYVDGITGTPESGKTLVQMIAAVAAGNVSIAFVDSVPSVSDAVNNTIYMVPKTVYKAVTNPTGNPSTSSYYELSNGSYVASQDVTVTSGKRYYVVDTESNNIYDEYIVGTKNGIKTLEKVGDTRIDLSGYVLASDLVAVTTEEINTLINQDTTAGAVDA